jgi:two-component system, OmpR family, sensor histidine kinase PhoQ
MSGVAGSPVLETQRESYSIQSRLLLALTVLLSVFLGLTGVVLDRAFRDSVEAGAVEQLQVQIYVLLAAAEERDGNFYLLEELREPRFGQLSSGLYGFISSQRRGELWRSESALDLQLSDPAILQSEVPVGENTFARTFSAEDEELFVVSYGVLWEDGESEYSFTVMESAGRFYSEIAEFRTSLWYWLGGVAVLLLLLQLLLLRWGLSPLHRMARDLKLIEVGNKEQLEGFYPKELKGVTDNLNLLIKSERKQQARYRTTLGDLAHSLKTPLAVVTGVMNGLGKNGLSANAVIQEQFEIVEEQLERMNQIVSYQLQRAVQSNSGSTLTRQVKIATVLDRILQALDKVYAQKNIQYFTNVDAQALFQGDERDLLEILGNVLDNAYKYGRSAVWVTVSLNELVTPRQLSIVIEDDGVGIKPAQREFVLQRGARADTLTRGQGIGLAVVTDIVSSYGGQIDIGNANQGGARIQLVFNQSG